MLLLNVSENYLVLKQIQFSASQEMKDRNSKYVIYFTIQKELNVAFYGIPVICLAVEKI